MTKQAKSLEGADVLIVVSEPWDLVSSDGSSRLSAKTWRVASFASGAVDEALVFRLVGPVSWRGRDYEYFLAKERHGRGLVDDFLLQLPIDCSLIAIDRSRAEGPEPFDDTWWRGGLAATALIQRLEAGQRQ